MRHSHRAILIFPVLLFFIACGDDKKAVEQTALELANNLDSNGLMLFRKYEYIQRGGVGYWSSVSERVFSWRCQYIVANDTMNLSIHGLTRFSADFPNNLPLMDTSTMDETIISALRDTVIRITQVTTDGKKRTIDTTVSIKESFREVDPFAIFSTLTTFVAKYNITGISCRPEMGWFNSFYIGSDYTLMYLPDTVKIKEDFKIIWLNEFKVGQPIKPHWSLIKY